MDSFIFFASIGSDLADAANEIAVNFGWNLPHFIAQIISFCIVAFLLHRFAYKPILKVLEERRERIAQGLANAEKIKKELAETEAARRETLEKAGAEANKMIEEARAAAARVQEQETQKAIKAAEDIIAKARESIEADRVNMLAELRREVGKLVVETTMKVTGKVLTPEDQSRLAEETNRELAA